MKRYYCATSVAALSTGILFSLSLPATAQQSASAAAMLEEVVVTARRREENLQDLPLSIAAITADAMQAQGIYNIQDVGEFVPNLTLTETDRRSNTAIFIRGVGGASPGNLRPFGTGLYIDGHYLPQTVGPFMSTLDVERVEVLRGPQGTLFGKNTTGGAVSVISAKPDAEFESRVTVRAASHGQRDLRAMVNVPFSETVAGRFAAAKETSDGYYYNRTLDENTGGSDLSAFRGALRFTPNDNWTIDLAASIARQRDDNLGGQCRPRPTQRQVDNLAAAGFEYDGPTYADGVGQWGGGMGHVERMYPGATLDFWAACETDNSMGDFVTSSEKDTFFDLDNDNFNGTFEWDSAGAVGGLDNLNVKLITSLNNNKWNYVQDRDYTSLPLDAIGTSPDDGHGMQRDTKTLELLFTAAINDRADFVLGTHYFDDQSFTGGQNCVDAWFANQDNLLSDPTASVACTPDGGVQFERLVGRSGGGPPDAGMSNRSRNESQAFFGTVSYDLTELWTLDVGARWTDEDRTFQSVEIIFPNGDCVPNPTTRLCQPSTYTLSYNNVADRGFFFDEFANFGETSPMISVTRTLEGGDTLESGIFYLRYAEGFLTGSFNDELNPILFPAVAPLIAYQPETIVNYEAGFKGTFADGRIRMSAAAFYMDYTDKQEQIAIDNSAGLLGGDPNIGIVTNAATVDIYGLEYEIRGQLWDRGFVSLDIGYLSNEYGQFSFEDPENPGSGQLIDRSNATIRAFAPDVTINASIEHAFQLGNGGTVTPQLGVYYQGDYEWLQDLDGTRPESYCHQDAYAKFRARVSYVPQSEDWQLAAFGYNVTDERYYETCNNARSGVFDYRYARPDNWGAEFTYFFGGS